MVLNCAVFLGHLLALDHIRQLLQQIHEMIRL